MLLFAGRFAPTLRNLLRIDTRSSGTFTATECSPSAAKNRFTPIVLAVGLLLALSGCETAVKPQAVEQPRPQPAAAAVPAGPAELLVDHAWVKDAATRSEQTSQRKVMEALRAKVLAGGSFIASWEAFGVDGTLWHVAEQEIYPSEVLPEGARNLPVGSISPILPGDGGLHLFRILGREAVKQ